MSDTIPAPPVPSETPNGRWKRAIEATIETMDERRQRATQRARDTNATVGGAIAYAEAMAYEDCIIQLRKLID